MMHLKPFLTHPVCTLLHSFFGEFHGTVKDGGMKDDDEFLLVIIKTSIRKKQYCTWQALIKVQFKICIHEAFVNSQLTLLHFPTNK